MQVKKLARRVEEERIEMGRFRQRFCARDGLESRVANRERHGARVQAGIAQALARFLAEAAQHGVEHGAIGGVLAKRVTMRNGFWLGIDEKFVGIFAARLAVERCAPLAELVFETLERNAGELADRLDFQIVKRRFGDFSNAGNAADAKRR